MASNLAGRSLLKCVSPKTSALLLCDMQEKFRNTTSYFNEIVSVSNRMLQAAQILNMSVGVTEQYPKGLGPIVPELGLPKDIPIFEKTCFTMVSDPLMQHLKKGTTDLKSVLLCGIEAHACIFQTCADLLDQGIDVHLVVDAISSRSMVDRMFAFRQMENAGAKLTTSECALLALLRDAKHPKFREVQKLIMHMAPDSQLLPSVKGI